MFVSGPYVPRNSFFFCQRGGKPHDITHYGTLKRARLSYTEMSAEATRPLFRNFFLVFFMFVPRSLRVFVSVRGGQMFFKNYI